MEEVDGVKIPSEEEISQRMADFRVKISKIEGISNVIAKTDFDNYILTIKLNYQNLKALNNAMNVLNNQKDQIHFANNGKGFERIASYPISTNLLKSEDKKEELEQANIIAIYTFDRNVMATTNANSKVSKNQKTVFLKQSVYNVLKKSSLMSNRIQLTP